MMCAHPRRLLNGDIKLVASRASASTTIGKTWTIFSFKSFATYLGGPIMYSLLNIIPTRDAVSRTNLRK